LVPEAFTPVERWVAARKARWHRQLDQLERYLAGADDDSK